MSIKDSIERSLEQTMYTSRWILAPIYLGLSLALVALAVKFFQELYHFMPHFMATEDSGHVPKNWADWARMTTAH